MTTTKKAIIFFVVLFVIIWAALFGVIHSTHVMDTSATPSSEIVDKIVELRVSFEAMSADVHIITETLTAYEEELKLCRARPFCQDRVVETLEKQDVPSHPASDEVDNANP